MTRHGMVDTSSCLTGQRHDLAPRAIQPGTSYAFCALLFLLYGWGQHTHPGIRVSVSGRAAGPALQNTVSPPTLHVSMFLTSPQETRLSGLQSPPTSGMKEGNQNIFRTSSECSRSRALKHTGSSSPSPMLLCWEYKPRTQKPRVRWAATGPGHWRSKDLTRPGSGKPPPSVTAVL